MVNRIKRNLTSDNVSVRLITTYIGFLIIFFAITIISYYLLPQGLLLYVILRKERSYEIC